LPEPDTGEQIPSNNVKFAKLQNHFANGVIAPKELKAFMDNQQVSKCAKAIVATTANSPLAKQFFNAVPTSSELSLSTPEMRISLKLMLAFPSQLKKMLVTVQLRRKAELTRCIAP